MEHSNFKGIAASVTQTTVLHAAISALPSDSDQWEGTGTYYEVIIPPRVSHYDYAMRHIGYDCKTRQNLN
jgi:hypothetical protein